MSNLSRRSLLASIAGIGGYAVISAGKDDDTESVGGVVSGDGWLHVEESITLYSANEYNGIDWDDGGLLKLDEGATIALKEQ